MKNQNNPPELNIARYCFKYSLIIGTLFFLTFCLTKNTTVLIFGFFYLCIALAINVIFFFVLLIIFISIPENRSETIMTMGLLLINIPIAWFYYWVIAEYPSRIF